MGIKNFHTWLHQKFPSCFIPTRNNNIYEYIYIDLNFILHNSIYGCKTEKDFIHRLTANLDIIFSNFIATKEIFFAIDGPASFAKIILQRERRLTNINKLNTEAINSLCLTPGIGIMESFEKRILFYINNLKNKFKYLKINCKTSFSNESDEGEIKICKRVIENGKNNQYRHLIVGNDADLVVLSMGMKPVYNINILIKGKDSNELISLKNLLHAHCKYLDKDDKIEVLCNSILREDFIVLSVMMGNDYLPKIAYIDYDKLWKTYKNFILKTNKTIINGTGSFDEAASNFMLMIYNSLANGFKKSSSGKYNVDQASSYLEGLLWCVDMYKFGICAKYDYMYNHNSPNPYELFFHLCAEKDKIQLVKSDFQPISSKIYPLIIMPKKASYLLTKTQQNLMNGELKYLYEKEECNECRKQSTLLTKARNELNEKISGDDDELVESLKSKFKIMEKVYKTHKNTHANFGIKDIHNIILIAKKNKIV